MSPFCPGARVKGLIPVRVIQCAQTLRGRLLDMETGDVLAELGPEEIPERDEVDFDFSFNMPYRPVPLKAVIERKEGDNWVKVKKIERDIDFLEPKTRIGSLAVPDRACAGYGVKPAVEVAAEECPQRLRGRLIDVETGDVIKGWEVLELESGGGNIFEFPFQMPWRNVSLRTEIQRFNPVDEVWAPVKQETKTVEQKDPARGQIVDRQIPKFGRPGYSTSGSVTVENEGECEGDVRVEGFLAGERIARSDYTLSPGDSQTLSYTGVMPPMPDALIAFRASSARREELEVTGTVTDQIHAARAVMLDTGRVFFHGGEKEFTYSGVIIAGNVEWEGPREVEKGRTIKSFRPLKGRVRPYMFAGKVGPKETDEVKFDADTLAYLKVVTSLGNSWSTYGTLRDKDTKRMTYSTIKLPTIALRSKLAKISEEELKKVAGIG